VGAAVGAIERGSRSDRRRCRDHAAREAHGAEYEQQRKEAADKLDVRASILDKLVQAERVRLGLDGGDDGKQGHAIEFTEIEPWPEPVNGAELLDEIATAVRSYVVMVNHFRDTCALWSMHTYLIDRFFISPRLGIHSPVKRCGKTTLLDVLSRLVARPLPASNVSSASVFRVVEAHRPTLLIDEADTFLPDNDELRGVINTGHRKGGVVLRTVGDDHEVRAFATYSACAIALIGKLPDTIHDRAVSGELKRKLPSETKTIKSFRPDRADHLDVLARKQARWAKDHADSIAARDPEMPPGIINRAADNWRPLLAIADEAGGEWPERVRAAVLAAHDAGEAGEQASWIELVLGDIRDTFAQLGGAPVAELFATSADLEIPSKALVETLIAIEGRPWAEMGKSRKPMSQNRLARILNPLDIRPGKIGPEDARLNGYKLGQFKDAFERYLPPEGASQPDIQTERDEIRTSDILQPDSHETGCPVEKCEKPNNDGLLSTCPVAKGGAGEKAQRTARPKSDDLPYTGEVVPVPDMGPDSLDPHGVPVAGNGGTEPGLSRRRLQELADWYQDQGHQRHNTGTLDTAALDDELRAILRDEVATPEHVEIEFERVMQIVFRI